MKTNTSLFQIIDLFESSIEILEQNRLEKKELSHKLKNFKFKCLKNQPLKKINEYKNREALKALYFVNFEEPLDLNLLNRTHINLFHSLICTYHTYYTTIFSPEEILLNNYDHTFSINLLYKLHTLRKSR